MGKNKRTKILLIGPKMKKKSNEYISAYPGPCWARLHFEKVQFWRYVKIKSKKRKDIKHGTKPHRFIVKIFGEVARLSQKGWAVESTITISNISIYDI